jgi:hypothetical protein
MKRSSIIIMVLVILLFILSWVLKSISYAATEDNYIEHGFLITFAAFLTLAIMSFLYRDNPIYKFAEHLFVGVSAAYWMTMGFWSTIVGNLIPRISEGLSRFFEIPHIEDEYALYILPDSVTFFIPVILGIMLLLRLTKKYGWVSSWPLAFIVGTTAGFNLVRYMRSDFIEQVSATFVPLLVDWQGIGPFFGNMSLNASGQLVSMASNWVIFIGVLCGLVYFFFSKEHKGVFGLSSRAGIWILMITFGASFGYTVMGRISLLVGRLTFLFKDWLGLVS